VIDAAQAAAELDERVRRLGTPQRAGAERAYLKSTLTHLGTPVPQVRKVAEQFGRDHRRISHGEMFALCDELWSQPVHERRVLVVELLHARHDLVGASDLPWVEQHLRECRTWALVDPLAGTLVAGIVEADPGTLPTLDRWVRDPDFWIRRSAVLALRDCLKQDRELDRFFRYADLLLPEREFFIRKVIGWVAREVGARHPTEVSAWLHTNLDRMNGVTIREAVKHLPDGAELMASWKAR